MLTNRLLRVLPYVFALAAGQVALAADGAEVAVKDTWLSPVWMAPSPTNDRIAFSLLGDPESTIPVLVIGDAGDILMTTAQLPPVKHSDVPLGWFPGGRRLLVFRRVWPWTGSDEELTDVLVLWVEDGRAESLSAGRGGLGRGTVVVDGGTCIGRATGGPFDRPGVYLYQATDEGWKATLLFADSEGRQQTTCIWAGRQEDTYRMVLRSEQKEGAGKLASYWRAEVKNGMEPKLELIASFDDEGPATPDVSADGSLLAVVLSWAPPSAGRLALIPFGAGGGEARNVCCGEMVSFASFSPKGQQIILWSPGWLEAAKVREGPRAEVLRMDLASGEITEVALPVELGQVEDLGAVAWLSETTVALGLVNRGVVALDLSTGAVTDVWRLPSVE